MEIDKLDRKILYHLDIDSRQSAKDIAAKTGSNKDTVNYRINRLISEKAISGFTTEVDTSRFGYSNIKTYLRFQDMDEKTEEEFFSYLSSFPEIGWIVHASGRWDALFCTWASSTFSFFSTLTKIMNRFSRNIFEKQIIHNINWFYYNRKWLQPEERRVVSFRYGGEPGSEKLDDTDLRILKELCLDGRVRFSAIAEKAGIPPQNVLNRVRALERKGVITKYGIDLDHSRFGIVFCKAFIELHNIDEKSLSEVYSFCEREPRIFALTTTLGAWDLELEMEVEKVEDMMEIMNRIKRSFPNSVKGYDSIVITKQSRINYLPQPFGVR
ncbi:MAG: Lrp/AsnC family transcriptional regulator [Candidatus Micrarchaeota archaeon]